MSAHHPEATSHFCPRHLALVPICVFLPVDIRADHIPAAFIALDGAIRIGLSQLAGWLFRREQNLKALAVHCTASVLREALRCGFVHWYSCRLPAFWLLSHSRPRRISVLHC